MNGAKRMFAALINNIVKAMAIPFLCRFSPDALPTRHAAIDVPAASASPAVNDPS
jgi:hypothetical protein